VSKGAGNVADDANDMFRIRALAMCAAFAVLSAPAVAGEATVLGTATAQAAADGSVRVTIPFTGPAPETQIVRSGEHSVHVVFIGATIADGGSSDLVTGEITQAAFGEFAGIGARLDLTLHDHALVRTERIGSTLVVHVPAHYSDMEMRPPAAPAAAHTVMMTLSFADVSEVAGALVKGAAVPSTDIFAAQSPFTPAQAQSSSSSSFSSSSSSSAPSFSAPAYVTIPTGVILPKDTPQAVRLDDHIAVDRRLNAVLITGTPAEIAEYQAVVRMMDVPTRSVVLETQIVELTSGAERDLGIEYSANGSLATATFGANSHAGPTASSSLAATLYALEAKNEARLLASPRIMALSAKPAAILSGEAVPIVNSVVVPGGSGTIVQSQTEYINVGVSLQIMTRVAEDGRITADLFCEVSSIIDYVGNAPRIAVRQELTSSIVSDGESLVVGGLLQQNEISSLRKIPGIGAIPIIGSLFNNSAKENQTTNLYVVITPHLVSNTLAPPNVAPTFALPTPPPLPQLPK